MPAMFVGEPLRVVAPGSKHLLLGELASKGRSYSAENRKGYAMGLTHSPHMLLEKEIPPWTQTCYNVRKVNLPFGLHILDMCTRTDRYYV